MDFLLKKSFFLLRYRRKSIKNYLKVKEISLENEKNEFFLQVDQMLFSGIQKVRRCFATLKTTPKDSGHILESFEKFFLIEFLIFRSHFLLTGADHPSELGIS